MVRETRIKSWSSGLTTDGTSGAASATSVFLNGKLIAIEVDAEGESEATINVHSANFSGDTAFDYLDVGFTGDSIYYPVRQSDDTAGASIAAQFQNFQLQNAVNVGLTQGAGSEFKVKVLYQ